jgi:hypothetical protein
MVSLDLFLVLVSLVLRLVLVRVLVVPSRSRLSVAAKSARDPRLARAGVSGFNKPKRTPSHPTKSHVVVAKEGSQVKTIRFGQQGVTGDRQPTKRQASFKARHAKNIAKGKMSAAYWANKVKW